MNARQLLRIAAFAAAVEIGGFALADAGGQGGGSAPVAPQPGQPPVKSGGGGGQPGQPPAAPSPGTPAAGHQPGQPPAAQPPAQRPRPTPSADRALPRTPRTAAEAEREHQARTAREERDRQPRPPGDNNPNNNPNNPTPVYRVYPRALYGWAPYNWWYSGNSYWWPPMEDYGNPYDYDNQNRRPSDEGTASSIPPEPPVTPPDTSAPTQDQAKALNELEASPEYRLALADLKLAQSDFDAARRRVLDKLKDNREYQTLIDERDHAAKHVEAAQASARIPTPEAVTPAAQRKLDINAKITRIEQAALDADPDARAAQERLVKTKARVTAMRQGAKVGAVR
jgi:hypothetical protein